MNNVLNAIDNPDLPKYIKNERLGLVTNQSGVSKNLIPTVDLLTGRYNVKAIFSPEHGLFGSVQAGDGVADAMYKSIPVYSLYGDTKEPTEEMLQSIDTAVFDLQDIGARFYTYLYTLANVMVACSKAKKRVVVLDRVNPVGCDKIEGHILNRKYASFVGMYPIPVRYGMTIGEFANYINKEERIGCDLSVVPIVNYTRNMPYRETGLCWVLPSPNMPTAETALIYLGTCLIEGTNLSEGRGTAKPFEFVGAPWLDSKYVLDKLNKMGLSGVMFSRVHFKPWFSKYVGDNNEGIQIHVTNPLTYEPYRTGIELIRIIKERHNELEITDFMPKLTGVGFEEMFNLDHSLNDYTTKRNEYKLYK
jgi:uncharacterized protein YbbC (DUF1343 family)